MCFGNEPLYHLGNGYMNAPRRCYVCQSPFHLAKRCMYKCKYAPRRVWQQRKNETRIARDRARMTAYNRHKALMSELPFATVHNDELPTLMPRPKQQFTDARTAIPNIASFFNDGDDCPKPKDYMFSLMNTVERERCEKKQLSNEIQSLKEQIVTLTQDKSELKTNLLRTEIERDEVKQKLEHENRQISTQLSQTQGECNDLKAELIITKKQCDELESDLKSNKALIEHAMTRVRELNKEIVSLKGNTKPKLDAQPLKFAQKEPHTFKTNEVCPIIDFAEFWFNKQSYSQPIRTLGQLISDLISKNQYHNREEPNYSSLFIFDKYSEGNYRSILGYDAYMSLSTLEQRAREVLLDENQISIHDKTTEMVMLFDGELISLTASAEAPLQNIPVKAFGNILVIYAFTRGQFFEVITNNQGREIQGVLKSKPNHPKYRYSKRH